MKLLTLFLFLLAMPLCWAQQVNQLQAEAFALEFMQQNNSNITHIKECQMSGSGNFYLINVQPEGWVMISTYMRANPIQCYSLQGTFQLNDTDRLTQMMIASVEEAVEEAKTNDALSVHNGWQSASLKSETPDEVKAIFNSIWNQQCMEYIFPDRTPLSGCVATAMAQVMYGFKYPKTGQGENSMLSMFGTLSVDFSKAVYDYDKMPSSKECSEEKAKLLYHCGVAMNMNYTEHDGSGANLGEVMTRMPQYFKYERSMIPLIYHDKVSFQTMLKQQLADGKPVFLADREHAYYAQGYSIGGHINLNLGGYPTYWEVGSKWLTTTTGAFANVIPHIDAIDTYPFVNDFETNWKNLHIAGNFVELSSANKKSGASSLRMRDGKIYQKFKIPQDAQDFYLSFNIMTDGTQSSGMSILKGYLSDKDGNELINLNLSGFSDGVKSDWKQVSVKMDQFAGQIIYLNIDHTMQSATANDIYIDYLRVGADNSKYAFEYAYVTNDMDKIIVEFNKKIKFNNGCNSMNFAVKINGSRTGVRSVWKHGDKGTEMRLTLNSAVNKGDKLTVTYQNYSNKKLLNPDTNQPINDITNPIEVMFEPQSPTGIEIEEEDFLKVFPNPTNDYFYCNKDIECIKVYSINGQLVEMIKNYLNGDKIEISHLNSGLYLLEICNNNDKTQLKLIKK
jgi:hypothetical protein